MLQLLLFTHVKMGRKRPAKSLPELRDVMLKKGTIQFQTGRMVTPYTYSVDP